MDLPGFSKTKNKACARCRLVQGLKALVNDWDEGLPPGSPTESRREKLRRIIALILDANCSSLGDNFAPCQQQDVDEALKHSLYGSGWHRPGQPDTRILCWPAKRLPAVDGEERDLPVYMYPLLRVPVRLESGRRRLAAGSSPKQRSNLCSHAFAPGFDARAHDRRCEGGLRLMKTEA